MNWRRVGCYQLLICNNNNLYYNKASTQHTLATWWAEASPYHIDDILQLIQISIVIPGNKPQSKFQYNFRMLHVTHTYWEGFKCSAPMKVRNVRWIQDTTWMILKASKGCVATTSDAMTENAQTQY